MDGTVTTPSPERPTDIDAPAADPEHRSGSAAIDRIDELTAEVGRLTAEVESRDSEVLRARADFQNYRRRRDREFEAAQQTAVTSFIAGLLPVLDDVDRAREHEQMSAGFRSVADGLDQQVARAGITRFGQAGEPFDPTVHEALMHGYSEEVDRPTATVVVQAGYRVGDRVIRAARVMVMEPPMSNAAQESLDTGGTGAGEGDPALLGDSALLGDHADTGTQPAGATAAGDTAPQAPSASA